MKKQWLIIYIIFLTFNLKSKPEFNLMTTLYNEVSQKRFLEYRRCIEENIKNKYIKKIFIFAENYEPDLNSFLCHPKIVIIPIKERPTYKLYFDFANENLKNELVIVCNTDIFFDESLGSFYGYNFNNKLIALTRYNVPEYKGKWNRHTKSHDSWIFKAPIKELNAKMKLGIPGCDLELLKLLVQNKINVVNPSLTIKSWHVHADDIRNYFNNAYKGHYNITVPFSELKIVPKRLNQKKVLKKLILRKVQKNRAKLRRGPIIK